MSKNPKSKAQTIIYEVNDSHSSIFLAASIRDLFDKIAYALASKPEQVKTWRTMDEFPGLNAPDLCGSWRQRIRFEAENAGRWFYIRKHDVSAPPICTLNRNDTSVPGGAFSLTDVFDPSYQIQKSLYLVSLGEETVESASKDLYDQIHATTSRLADADIFIKKVRAIHTIMGGQELLPKPIEDPVEVLRTFPQICKDRFEELAARAFPQPSMTL